MMENYPRFVFSMLNSLLRIRYLKSTNFICIYSCALTPFVFSFFQVLVSDPSDTELYFGTVGSGSVKVVNFALVNENPVAVQIRDLSLNMSDSTIYAVAVEKGNATNASVAITSSEFNDTLSVSDHMIRHLWKQIKLTFIYN